MDDIEITPEMTVEEFVNALSEEGRDGFYPGEAQKLSHGLGRPMVEVSRELKGWGLKVLMHSPKRPT